MKPAASGNQLLDQLDPEALEALKPHLSPVRFAQGHVLFEPGDRIGQVHFPIEGVISVVTVMNDGSTVEVMTIGVEGAAGIGAALGVPTAFARAIWQIGGAALRIDVARLRDVCARAPKVLRLLEAYSQQQLAEAQQTAACNALHNLEPRMAKWLLRCHDRVEGDQLQLTQEFLSDMLGSQRTTVTQVAGALQAAGLIRYQRGRIEVQDRPGLERISCECYAIIRQRAADLGLSP